MSPYILSKFLLLGDVLTSDKTANETKGLPKMSEELSNDPKMLSIFHDLIKHYSLNLMPECARAMNLDNITKVLDVGGGNGSLAIELCKAHPNLSVGIYDRPEAALLAIENIENQCLQERIQVIQGNYFENIQEGFDCIVIRSIIHDLNDEDCAKILTNCRSALAAGNKLIIIESLVDKNSRFYRSHIALHIMSMIGNNGKERKIDDVESLLIKTGFRLESVKQALYLSVIEALAI